MKVHVRKSKVHQARVTLTPCPICRNNAYGAQKVDSNGGEVTLHWYLHLHRSQGPSTDTQDMLRVLYLSPSPNQFRISANSACHFSHFPTIFLTSADGTSGLPSSHALCTLASFFASCW